MTMKTTILSLLGFFLILNSSIASNIPLDEAREMAVKAFAFKSEHPIKRASDVKVVSEYVKSSDSGDNYYVFNLEPTGFIVMSADDRYNAILAFSDESTIDFDAHQRNESFWATLGKHELRIEYVKKNGAQFPNIKREWAALKRGTFNEFLSRDPEGMVIPPLTTTKWNQDKYYNAYTPRTTEIGNVDGGTYCGCAPIAMSQLIKYHNYPPRGNGSISYDDPQYGPQTVDFCNTEYQWENMPDSLSDYNDDVAEFIYHVGVSTRTYYSTIYTETFNSNVRNALVFNFNFDEAASWFLDDPNDSDFAQVAINDLNQGRPVLLTGDAATGGAHSWIVDGYGYFLNPGPTQPDEYFHCNWGWGGDNNGWFLDTDATWSPIPFETGTYFINFYYNRLVVHNVFPSTEQCAAPTSLRQSGDYLYTTVPDGEEVIFRYRQIGHTQWTESNVQTAYYYRATSLEPGTDYEFQVKRKCCPSNWSDYSFSHRFTTPGAQGSPCDNLFGSRLTTSSITENSAYVYTSKPYGDVSNQFRYRFVGGALWSYTDVSSNYFRRLSNLAEGTDYEFQVRHECEQGTWTEFSDLENFATQGVTACNEVFDVDLYTSNTTDNGTYVYTTQPYGRVNNKFRYRPIGSSDWTESNEDDKYYRYLTDLMPGTEYEFQVAHFCQGWVWTDWSYSSSFKTTGGGSGNCDAISGDRLYFNSVSASNAYVYTPQPFGLVANQFRYKITSAPNWNFSTTSTQYYRYLRNLVGNTDYEFQVRHECAVGEWTDWSDSQNFTTSFRSPNPVEKRLLPPVDGVRQVNNAATVFPNPATDQITIAFDSELQSDVQLNISNVGGERLLSTEATEGSIQTIVDLSELMSGVYIMSYQYDDQIITKKIFKL